MGNMRLPPLFFFVIFVEFIFFFFFNVVPVKNISLKITILTYFCDTFGFNVYIDSLCNNLQVKEKEWTTYDMFLISEIQKQCRTF
jgi:hypothetical protein